jgi:hypothetical protein
MASIHVHGALFLLLGDTFLKRDVLKNIYSFNCFASHTIISINKELFAPHRLWFLGTVVHILTIILADHPLAFFQMTENRQDLQVSDTGFNSVLTTPADRVLLMTFVHNIGLT